MRASCFSSSCGFQWYFSGLRTRRFFLFGPALTHRRPVCCSSDAHIKTGIAAIMHAARCLYSGRYRPSGIVQAGCLAVENACITF